MMWCLETIIDINKKAGELAAAGLPERNALEECGIRVSSNTPKTRANLVEAAARRVKSQLEKEGVDATVLVNKCHRTIIMKETA